MNYTTDQISQVLRTRPLYYGPTKIKVDKVSGESILLSDSTSILISTITELKVLRYISLENIWNFSKTCNAIAKNKNIFEY